MSFKAGDVVRLKSGGPLMTVEAASASPGAWICVWFDGQKQTRSSFAAATLAIDE